MRQRNIEQEESSRSRVLHHREAHKTQITGEVMPVNFQKIAGVSLLLLFMNGCVLTKVITVPMRVGGAVLSIIPVVGDAAHDAIDETAEQIDKVPL